MAVAFSADSPAASRVSWHAHFHDAGYLVLVLAAISSTALLSCARSNEKRWRPLRTAARVLLPVLVAGVAISGFDEIAELGRYVLIGGLLVWAHVASRAATRVSVR